MSFGSVLDASLLIQDSILTMKCRYIHTTYVIYTSKVTRRLS